MEDRLRLGLIGLVLALMCAAAASAQTPSVDDIVNKTMAARGGLDKLRAVNTMKMIGKVSMQGRDFPITVMAKRPNLMIQEMTIDGTRVVSAFDGDKVWVVNPILGINEPQEMSGAMADEIRDQSIFDGPLVGYKERGETLELVGPNTVGDVKTWKLKLTRANGRTMFIDVDATTGFELQWSRRVDQGGMNVDVDSVMSDYQPTDKGIVVPRTMRTLVGGHQQGLLKVDSVTFDTPIDDATFQMPKQE
jgi:outer membrane lipoprotein-sorting protein